MARYYLTQYQAPFSNNSISVDKEVFIDRIAIHLAEDFPLEWLEKKPVIVTLTGKPNTGISEKFQIGQTGLLELEGTLLRTIETISFNAVMPAGTLVDLWTTIDQG